MPWPVCLPRVTRLDGDVLRPPEDDAHRRAGGPIQEPRAHDSRDCQAVRGAKRDYGSSCFMSSSSCFSSGLVAPPGSVGIPGRPREIMPTKLLTEKRTTSA